jgi:hypothetical protein
VVFVININSEGISSGGRVELKMELHVADEAITSMYARNCLIV